MNATAPYCMNRAEHAERDQYQGHANRETWSFLLLVNNDEDLQGMLQGYVSQREPAYVNAAADCVKEWAEGLLSFDAYEFETGEVQPADLIRMAQEIGSLDRIAWRDVALSVLDDIDAAAIADRALLRCTTGLDGPESITWHEM